MAELFALLVVTLIGYYAILDLEPNDWFKSLVNRWWQTVLTFEFKSEVINWILIVALPAIAVGLLDVLFHHFAFSFIFDLVILFLTTAIGTFIIKHKALIKAVYANDVKAASNIANTWQGKTDEVMDAKNIFVKRMLEVSMQRLHFDVLIIVLWYLFLGAGGAVFIAIQLIYSNLHNLKFKEIDALIKWCSLPSILAMSVAGNMVPTIAVMPKLDINLAAFHATDNLGDSIDIEKVPLFGSFLMRTFLVGVGSAIIFIMLVYI